MVPAFFIAAAVAAAALAERASKPSVTRQTGAAMAAASAARRTLPGALRGAYGRVEVTPEARAWAEALLAKIGEPQPNRSDARRRCEESQRTTAMQLLDGRIDLERARELNLAATLALWAATEDEADKRTKLLEWEGKLMARTATYDQARAALDLDDSAAESFLKGAVSGVKRFGKMLGLW